MDTQDIPAPTPPQLQATPAASSPQAPAASTPDPKPVRRTRKTWLIIFVVGGLIVAGIFLTWRFWYAQNVCLSRNDYFAVTGETLPKDAPFAPTSDFYGIDVDFTDKKASYADSSVEARVQKLGEFAASHPFTSLHFTIQAFYLQSDSANTEALVNQRAAVIRETLTKAGVRDQAVSIDVRAYIRSNGDDTYDDTYEDTGQVLVSLASAEGCRILP